MEISKRSSELLNLVEICSHTFIFVFLEIITLTLYFQIHYIQWTNFYFPKEKQCDKCYLWLLHVITVKLLSKECESIKV